MSRRALLALVLVAVMLPAAQAQDALRAQRVEAESAHVETQEALLLHLRGNDPASEVELLEVRGAHIEVHAYEAESLRALSTGPAGADDHLVQTPDPGSDQAQVTSLQDGMLTLHAYGRDHVLNVHSDVLFEVEGTTGQVALQSIRDALLRRDGITADDATMATYGDGAWFGSHAAKGENVLASAASAVTRFVVRGDFVIELDGIDLQTLDGTVVRSTDDRSGHTGVGLVDEQAHSATSRFVRILVTGGELQVAVGATGSLAAWVQASAEAQMEGPVDLIGATGSLDGKPVGAHSRVEGPLRLSAASADGGLTLVADDPRPSASRIVPVPAEMGLILLVGSMAVVSLVLTIIISLRLWRRTPPMDEVEEALERRDYRRAAALAGKIHRRRPQMQEAMLSRAVALSKMGEQRRVVQEVEAYLARDPHPSDGALHYVLGLAYMDLGREQQARSHLNDAARLTPDLGADVSARLARSHSGGNAYA